jgi:ligand-binding sensor domain-containing protein
VGSHTQWIVFQWKQDGTENKILPYSIKDMDYEPSSQKLWVLSESKGLFALQHGRVVDSISISNQFGEVICRDLCRDDAGNLWIGTASGLFRVHQSAGQLKLTNFWGVLGWVGTKSTPWR